MPNGGHICCEYCTYNRTSNSQCDMFGIETSPFILCRAFRKPKQSHTEARKQWPMLKELEPGVIYAIDNSTYALDKPKPIYHVQECE